MTQSRAKELAEAHLAWVAGYNKALGLTMIPTAAAEYLYQTAMYHGHGHGVEDQRNGVMGEDQCTTCTDRSPCPRNMQRDSAGRCLYRRAAL